MVRSAGQGTLFDRSRHAMLLADDRRRYVDANDAALRLFRVTREQLLTMSIDDITPPENRGLMEHAWAELLARGSLAGTYTVCSPSGERIDVEYSAIANIVPGRHLSIFVTPLPEPVAAAVGGPLRASLTRREREVVELVALGATSEEVARRLVISEETVRNHVRNAMRKLGVRTRAHAVTEALRRGELSM